MTAPRTWLPWPSYLRSAQSLDDGRLAQQCRDVLAVLRELAGECTRWRDHPTVRQWRGHAEALGACGLASCAEAERRGLGAGVAETIYSLTPAPQASVRSPAWLGNPWHHSAVRGQLLVEGPEHYAALGWTDPPHPSRIWPSRWVRVCPLCSRPWTLGEYLALPHAAGGGESGGLIYRQCPCGDTLTIEAPG